VKRLAAALVLATVLAGCGSSTASSTSTTLTVFAAASLQKTFTTLGRSFEQQHPGTKVTFSFAGSSDLVTQLSQGAPADVFAAADTANMQKVTDAKLAAAAPVNFATNTLTIVVPPANPARVTTFADLAKPDTKVVVCAPQVPCGSAAKKIESSTGTVLKPVSEESSVTDVLGKVTSGEADAGLVYVTDAKGAGSAVQAVPFPESTTAVNTDPIVALRNAKQPALAQQFADFVTGPSRRQVLRDAGFGAP
jgi:molybdate transport system substrate-binding protein